MEVAAQSDNTYVTDLPNGIDKDTVTQIFAAYGATVVQCKVLDNAKGGSVHALVRFSSADEAAQVVEKLSGQVLEGLDAPITIRFATPGGGSKGDAGGYGAWKGPPVGWEGGGSPYAGSGKGTVTAGPGSLYITGLPAEMEKDQLRALFGEYGRVIRAAMLRFNGHPGGKRAALVEYETGEEAMMVRANFNGQVMPGLETPITIEPNMAVLNGGVPAPVKSTAKGAKGWNKGGCDGGCKGWGGGDKGGSKGGAGCGKSGCAAGVIGIHTIIQALEASGGLPGGTGQFNDDSMAVAVSGLPDDTLEDDVYRIFCPFGAIAPVGVKVITNPNGSCSGNASIHYLSVDSANGAVSVLDQCVLPSGGTLIVKMKNEVMGCGKAKGGKGANEGGGFWGAAQADDAWSMDAWA